MMAANGTRSLSPSAASRSATTRTGPPPVTPTATTTPICTPPTRARGRRGRRSQPHRPAPKVDAWRRRSATGAVLTGFALGLQQALGKEQEQPAIVMQTSGDPPRTCPSKPRCSRAAPARASSTSGRRPSAPTTTTAGTPPWTTTPRTTTPRTRPPRTRTPDMTRPVKDLCHDRRTGPARWSGLMAPRRDNAQEAPASASDEEQNLKPSAMRGDEARWGYVVAGALDRGGDPQPDGDARCRRPQAPQHDPGARSRPGGRDRPRPDHPHPPPLHRAAGRHRRRLLRHPALPGAQLGAQRPHRRPGHPGGVRLRADPAAAPGRHRPGVGRPGQLGLDRRHQGDGDPTKGRRPAGRRPQAAPGAQVRRQPDRTRRQPSLHPAKPKRPSRPPASEPADQGRKRWGRASGT